MDYTIIFISLFVAACFTGIIIPVIIQLCQKYRLYDEPNSRKVHSQAIPRLGGIAFLPGTMLGMAASLIAMHGGIGGNYTFTVSSFVMIAGAIIIYMIGIIDDIKGMEASHKFIIQFVAAILLPLCKLRIDNLHGLFGVYEIPVCISYILTVFVILLIVNSINLIDGIDGLASGLAILILAVFIFLFSSLNAIMFCILAAGLMGTIIVFFIFNFFGKVGKHKIFMGDAGSLLVGYVIAYLAIKYQMDNTETFTYRENSMLASYTLVIIPSFDLIRVALSRIKEGKGMFQADKRHIHHRIMNMGFTMHQTLFIILGLFAFFCALNFILNYLNISFTVVFITDIVIFYLLNLYIHHHRRN
ncbi:MAG: undecaprenyl/decaprenyl-phosphate alpha-N-acetylglucosaminyl 1-phosphate transferase [Bacteroides sp.]|nr:undecaprenyl/decaprenyl-phosphate alpha-N-acetylglucosaminyl 1-phosphate transferase [Roseburia sp.]MCM1345483.1 undecaprenyl/decaprenyl-phosphate alpha-N-acetylglucosaminyl 1-phosphate transferase [Bacteroides sp.]MCM1419992.1 undecaprenyl/decaprenyl-phosphate alpha-N-acetylglucosaminyl 1-phosphate transferase [Bacteroides sp.]